MKKTLLAVACIASIGLFFFGQKTPENSSDLTLENIEAVGLSASETNCDASNNNPCKVYRDGKLVLDSTGKGTIWD
ncbi:MAG: NVEALA domain-containing protein [Paramuribaculum sp.]|nr:NVEALA domain-containing protein [Paramuribaculum sp.]